MEKIPKKAMPKPGRRRNGRYRKVRLFAYGIFLMLCIIVIPAILIPPWLASRGVEINAISGISLGKTIVIKKLSLSINKTLLTIEKLTLEHFVDDESPIADSSWRLFSPNLTIRLAPEIQAALAQQNLSFGPITLKDTAFVLTDLTQPYVFSAQAETADMLLTINGDNEVPQHLEGVSLVLTTSPYVALTGMVNQANLTLIHPHDIRHYPYPLVLQQGHFSLNWQPFKTPLTVHLAKVLPGWETVDADVLQSGSDISVMMNLQQPTTSIQILADKLMLAPPKQLPEFIKPPEQVHEGLHLGQLISGLSQLPLQTLKVNQLTYGSLILDARLDLETPRYLMNEPAHKATFQLNGKALAPDPYDLGIQIKHTGPNDAHLTGEMTSPEGHRLSCQGDISFISPLPKSLFCEANVKQTAALTKKLKLFDLPDATLDQPITLSAVQTDLQLRKKIPPASDQDPDNTPDENPSDPIQSNRSGIQLFREVEKASYRLSLTLPKAIRVNLGALALKHSLLTKVRQKPLQSLLLNTDGRLLFDVNYQSDTLSLSLAPQNESLSFSNTEFGHKLDLVFDQLICAVTLRTQGESSKPLHTTTSLVSSAIRETPISPTQQKQPHQPSQLSQPGTLQCHSISQLAAEIKALYPTEDVTVENVTFKSTLESRWSDNALTMVLKQPTLQAKHILLPRKQVWLENQLDNVVAQADALTLSQRFRDDETQQLTLSSAETSPLTVSARWIGQQIIAEDTASNASEVSGSGTSDNLTNATTSTIFTKPSQRQQRRKPDDKSQLPVQKYDGEFNAEFNAVQLAYRPKGTHPSKPKGQPRGSNAKSTLRADDQKPVSLTSQYKAGITLSQNGQRLPMIRSEGNVSFVPDTVNISANLLNGRHAELARFLIQHDFPTHNTDITLQRHSIHFSPKLTLKKHYLPGLPIDYDLHSGTLSFDAHFSNHAHLNNRSRPPKRAQAHQWQGQFGLYASELGGYVGNTHFADLSVSLLAELTPNGFRSLQPISLHASYLNMGVLLENLYAVFELDTEKSFYRLDRANANTLGGSVSTHQITSNSLKTIPAIPILIHGIRLNQLIDAVDGKDIVMTGILDGTLPLSFSNGKPVIEHGKLHARYPGGVLKYKEGSNIDRNVENAGENSLLVVSKILKNYNYHNLTILLDYSKEGNLDVSAMFKGHNPDVLSGQPVNLNLNIQENIPALLKTLSVINSSKLESLFLKQIGVDN
ncbi:hypothetical protein C9I92_14385 [Photobacterium ganghwense]|nr:hypothetical protein C9I92_14385 [Photobacterium ganghwense]